MFNGAARLQSDFLAPAAQDGASPSTIIVWAFNPSVQANVGQSGRGIVLFIHCAFDGWGLADWAPWEQDAFYQAVKGYNVMALIGGHGHVVLNGQWNRIDYYEVGATHLLDGDNGYASSILPRTNSPSQTG